MFHPNLQIPIVMYSYTVLGKTYVGTHGAMAYVVKLCQMGNKPWIHLKVFSTKGKSHFLPNLSQTFV